MIATVPSLILPLFYPDLKYFEEGCLKVPHERNESFLVVSPDGSFRESEYALVVDCLDQQVNNNSLQSYACISLNNCVT
jgi:hypothetical protein